MCPIFSLTIIKCFGGSTDLTELNRNMAALQNQQKERVQKLRDLENKPELGQLGFDLKPLTKEWQAMAQALLPSSL